MIDICITGDMAYVQMGNVQTELTQIPGSPEGIDVYGCALGITVAITDLDDETAAAVMDGHNAPKH